LPIKPPVHQGRTMPLEETVERAASGRGAMDSAPPAPFFKRYMIPLIFLGVFLLAAGILAVGWWQDAQAKKAAEVKEARDKYVRDSTKNAQDSIATVVADSIARAEQLVRDSLRADSIAKAGKKKGKNP
jgi:hypothetical protein